MTLTTPLQAAAKKAKGETGKGAKEDESNPSTSGAEDLAVKLAEAQKQTDREREERSFVQLERVRIGATSARGPTPACPCGSVANLCRLTAGPHHILLGGHKRAARGRVRGQPAKGPRG